MNVHIMTGRWDGYCWVERGVRRYGYSWIWEGLAALGAPIEHQDMHWNNHQ